MAVLQSLLAASTPLGRGLLGVVLASTSGVVSVDRNTRGFGTLNIYARQRPLKGHHPEYPFECLVFKGGGASSRHNLQVFVTDARTKKGNLSAAISTMQKLRDLGHPRLGIAHRGGVIAIDIAEIALPVDKPVAHREFLRQPDHRIIDRRIPMRVELAHDIADNAG